MKKRMVKSDSEKEVRHTKRIWMVLICLVALTLFGVGGWFYVDGLAYKIVHVEAGIVVSASDFFKKADERAIFTQDSESFDTTVPGEYQVKVKSGLFTHECTLIIEDTIAPTAEAVHVDQQTGEAFGAEAFVTNIQDATPVTVSYVTEPDFYQAGPQTVQVILTDRGGNWTIVEAELFLVHVERHVTVEAGGGAPDIGSFVIAAREAAFVTPIGKIDYNSVGDYEILLNVDGEQYSSILHVVDTVPPQLEVHDIEGYVDAPRKAEDFVTETQDVTEVTIAFRQEPDLSKAGSQEVEIVATDAGGNETSKTALLTLEEDTEPPVIHGAADLVCFIGEGVSYRKNVAVTDNCPEGVTLEVDSSQVNQGEEGVYPVTYTARDVAGNTTTVTVNVTVRLRTYTLDDVNVYADAVLASITTPDMSLRDKAWAIYSYVRSHVAYTNHSDKGDWIKAAYEGLATGKGDCYVYACTSKALLTRAGIPNIDIKKIPTRSEHYWNLVDVGDGWYHFDTTPRRPDLSIIFLWTDEEIMAYSAIHSNAFNYDRTLYTDITIN